MIGQILIYVFFATLVAFFISGIRGRQVESAEKTRGYSTLPLQKDAVDVIDVETGLVIRHASEQPLRNRGDIARSRLAAEERSKSTK
ncbi:hypothetical protein [Frondihabitans australicus]|uniref:hypothetical protein n=1 Tax=Frondihabitans australicus TaxID=386892 RepID=UPI0011C40F7C|nr:hypothetical protein [Frondihabitans australicus]